jgi:hypothetical protein
MCPPNIARFKFIRWWLEPGSRGGVNEKGNARIPKTKVAGCDIKKTGSNEAHCEVNNVKGE